MWKLVNHLDVLEVRKFEEEHSLSCNIKHVDTIWRRIFNLKVASTGSCIVCNKVNQCSKNETIIRVSAENNGNLTTQIKKALDVFSCFDHCKFCQSMLQPSTFLVVPPIILLVEINRGEADNSKKKVNMSIPDDIEMQFAFGKQDEEDLITAPSLKYRLRAVICHYGESNASGHYVTYQKDGDAVMLQNDISVSDVDVNTAKEDIESNGFLCFFEVEAKDYMTSMDPKERKKTISQSMLSNLSSTDDEGIVDAQTKGSEETGDQSNSGGKELLIAESENTSTENKSGNVSGTEDNAVQEKAAQKSQIETGTIPTHVEDDGHQDVPATDHTYSISKGNVVGQTMPLSTDGTKITQFFEMPLCLTLHKLKARI